MKKIYSFLGMSMLALTLAACSNGETSLGMYADEATSSEESVASSVSSESVSLNTAETSDESEETASSSEEEIVSSEETEEEIVSEEVVVESSDSVASEAANTTTMSAEEIESSIIAAEPENSAPAQSSEIVPSSEVENSESTYTEEASGEAGAYDNGRARELLAEAAPLISQASQDAFKSDEYFFMPTLINDNLAQVDVYRQSPDGQGHANLITVYRYDAEYGTLMMMDMSTGTWENTAN